MTEFHRGEEPLSRMDRICDEMLTTFENSLELDDCDKVIILISNDDQRAGSLAHHGYDEELNDTDVFEDLVAHSALLAKAHGMNMEIFQIPRGQG